MLQRAFPRALLSFFHAKKIWNFPFHGRFRLLSVPGMLGMPGMVGMVRSQRSVRLKHFGIRCGRGRIVFRCAGPGSSVSHAGRTGNAGSVCHIRNVGSARRSSRSRRGRTIVHRRQAAAHLVGKAQNLGQGREVGQTRRSAAGRGPRLLRTKKIGQGRGRGVRALCG